MNKKKFIICFVILLILVEGLTLLLYPIIFPEKEQEYSQTLRIGIPQSIVQQYGKNKIIEYFKSFEKFDLYIQPCFILKHTVLLNAFLNDSLDYIYINPAAYYLNILKKNKNASTQKDDFEIVLVHSLKEDRNHYRPIILSRTEKDENGKIKIEHLIPDTKGKRLTFTEQGSMTGYIMPKLILENELPETLEKWFAKIEFSLTMEQALLNLIEKRTDVIALDSLILKKFLQQKKYQDIKVTMLSFTETLPENIICTKKSSNEKKNDLKKLFIRAILSQNSKKSLFSFYTPGFDYLRNIDKLKEKLDKKGIRTFKEATIKKDENEN